MNGRKLFPRVSYKRRRRQVTDVYVPDPNAPFSHQEVAHIQKALRNPGTPATCPRHGCALRVTGPIARGDNAVWLVRCDEGQRELTVRAGPNRRPQPPTFDDLVVSKPKDKKLGKSLPATMMSLTLHGGLLVAAVMATATATEVIQEIQRDTTMVFVSLKKEPEPTAAPPPRPAPPPKVRPLAIVSFEPPPQGFQVLTAPVGVPNDIPPMDFTEQFDPRNFSGAGVEGGVFDGVKGGTGSVDASRIFRAATVDERPERLSGPPLQYPAALREAGIGGFVIIEFVIETTGRVNPSSIRIVRSSNAAFEGPATDVIRKSLFRPGRVRGIAVRVLVRQQIDFNFVAARAGN